MDAVVNRTLEGLGWIVISGVSFVIFIALIHYLGATLHPVQAAFIRYALSILILAPVFLRQGAVVLYTRQPGRHALRGFVHALGVLLWFYAITKMPIAEATAMSYTIPIFVTLGAVVFLKERLTYVRVIAVAGGFLGVLVILRPGVAVIGPGALAILLSAPLFAVSKLLVKTLVRVDSSTTTVIYLSIFATLTMAVPALMVWTTPSFDDLLFLMFAALFATLSHYCLGRALKLIDVSVAQPAEFLRLVWATLLGLAMFGETPSPWIWVGGAIVVLSVSIAARFDTKKA